MVNTKHYLEAIGDVDKKAAIRLSRNLSSMKRVS
jgi:hypothetical protein